MTRTERRGVSLLEIIVAVAVLASGILVVLMALPQTYAALRQNEEYVLGVRFTQHLDEQYRRRPFPVLQAMLDGGGEGGEQQVFAMLNGTPRWITYAYQIVPVAAPCPSADLAALNVSAYDISKDTLAWSITVKWSGHATGSQAYSRSLVIASQLRRGESP